jgi:hypothetical protein
LKTLIQVISIFCFSLLMGICCYSQNVIDNSYATQFPTENVNFKKDANNAKNQPKRKNISFIYKESSQGILYGNPCAVEATRKMGFEYVLQPPGIPGSPGDKELERNNFLVNLKLIFTRGPFWKLTLNKRIKQCRINSGDIVG